jgi:hypothetical protein
MRSQACIYAHLYPLARTALSGKAKTGSRSDFQFWQELSGQSIGRSFLDCDFVLYDFVLRANRDQALRAVGGKAATAVCETLELFMAAQ